MGSASRLWFTSSKEILEGAPNLVVKNLMPINHADGTSLAALVCSPIVAGVAAAKAHAGWFTIGFVVLGVGAGVVVAYAVNKVAYLILNFGVTRKPWWIVWPLFTGYVFFPYAIAAAGWAGIWFGTGWLVRNVL